MLPDDHKLQSFYERAHGKKVVLQEMIRNAFQESNRFDLYYNYYLRKNKMSDEIFFSSEQSSFSYYNEQRLKIQALCHKSMAKGVETGVWSLDYADIVKKTYDLDSTLSSLPPLPQTVPPARPTKALAQPRPIVIDVEENQFLAPPAAAQERPQITDLVSKVRGRPRKNPPKRTDDYKKNITRDSLHKIAREMGEDPCSKRIISHKLAMLNIDYSEFQELLKSISIRHETSNRDLLWLYLAPKVTDQKYQLKRVFTEYFMFFLESYFAISAEQSDQIQRLNTYINYSRQYLSYLGQYVAHRHI